MLWDQQPWGNIGRGRHANYSVIGFCVASTLVGDPAPVRAPSTSSTFANLGDPELPIFSLFPKATPRFSVQDLHAASTGSETGLVAYYPFDEGTGTTVFDQTVNGNDGSFVDVPEWLATA